MGQYVLTVLAVLMSAQHTPRDQYPLHTSSSEQHSHELRTSTVSYVCVDVDVDIGVNVGGNVGEVNFCVIAYTVV